MISRRVDSTRPNNSGFNAILAPTSTKKLQPITPLDRPCSRELPLLWTTAQLLPQSISFTTRRVSPLHRITSERKSLSLVLLPLVSCKCRELLYLHRLFSCHVQYGPLACQFARPMWSSRAIWLTCFSGFSRPCYSDSHSNGHCTSHLCRFAGYQHACSTASGPAAFRKGSRTHAGQRICRRL
jgi:hypothetical protein